MDFLLHLKQTQKHVAVHILYPLRHIPAQTQSSTMLFKAMPPPGHVTSSTVEVEVGHSPDTQVAYPLTQTTFHVLNDGANGGRDGWSVNPRHPIADAYMARQRCRSRDRSRSGSFVVRGRVGRTIVGRNGFSYNEPCNSCKILHHAIDICSDVWSRVHCKRD